MCTIKKQLCYLILLKKQLVLSFFYKFSGLKKCLIKSLFNEFTMTLEQQSDKPLNEYYRQVVVYVIRLCVC